MDSGARRTKYAGAGALRAAAAALTAALLALCFAAAAQARTEDVIAPQHPPLYTPEDGWQAGTCKAEPPQSAKVCSVATPDQFFERAAAHPNRGFTQFIVKHTTSGSPPLVSEKPVAELKTVRVDLPVGLSVNPGATDRCPLPTFEAGAAGCPSGSKVGESAVTVSAPPLGLPVAPIPGITEVPVYNVIPRQGEPARFGLELAGNEVYLEADVAWSGDFHEGFTIEVPKALPVPVELLTVDGAILKNRLVFDGRAGDGTFITTPSTCLGESAPGPSGHAYSTYLLAGSYAEAASPGYRFPQSAEPAFESPIPPGTSPKECATIPYAPALGVDPNTAQTDSPSGATVDVDVPHILGADTQDSSNTRAAQVALPTGMGINPAAASGLQTCTDAQFRKQSPTPGTDCPTASKIGRVEIESPPLPEGTLAGNVYVGQQLSRDPASGQEYRIFIDAESARYGISVRLVGNVSADPRSGRLTTTISETPQVPFSSFALDFDGGPRAVLSSPPVCKPENASGRFTPWSGNPSASSSDPIVLTSAPGGGACARTLGERPFAPAFAAKPSGTKAGAFSPLTVRIDRGEGQQELKAVDITLAPGMTGRLAGIPYCSEAALAAAANKGGGEEKASPSCAAASRIGTATIAAGTGSSPLRIEGQVFLSGPYHGAPLSLAVVTPATAGPFDLGTVVVRVALFVDPETAQIHAVSDPIPDVFGGAKLSLRSVGLDVNRKNFTLNPTSCGPLSSGGALRGGGADPANPAAFSSFPVSTPFQTSACDALKFRPKLFTRLYGGRKATRRGQHPKFRAVLVARDGDANIARAAVTLPHSQFLDQSHIRTVCTKPKLASNDCPSGSIYGYARARTPLLDDELAGPVYLVPSDNPLPDLLVDLRGQVDVRLRGAISSVGKGRIKNVFQPLPDVPVSKFVLTMKGGRKGLLVNSRDLCAHPSFSLLKLKAQNGKQLRKKKLPLRVPGCKGGKKEKRD
jgi:invasion protein IalB